ncbi:50S ribosomal protein L18 [Candidatus Woesebacteria bacterium]|nr:50S ribosomal protein L18 [Candidatus Woesebacteria bacterium]
MKNKVLLRRKRVQKRVRSKIIRQSAYPRLSVHRTNKHIYAQVIDDHKMTTLVSASDTTAKDGEKLNSTQKAQYVGKTIAELMKKEKITQVVFDRGAYPYKGRIKVLAESVREGGITI